MRAQEVWWDALVVEVGTEVGNHHALMSVGMLFIHYCAAS